MNYLLDTHRLLWAAAESANLSRRMYASIQSRDNTLFFSAASLWEVSIKAGPGRRDFTASPALLRRRLLEHGYEEPAISGRHAVAASTLPMLHKDPVDRMPIAQAQTEAMTLLTNDQVVTQYSGPIEMI